MTGISTKQLNLIVRTLQEIIPEHEVWAFGSRVSGVGAKPFSDLDLAVLTSKPLSLQRLTILKETFSESNLPFRIDIVDWSETDTAFQTVIRNQHEVLKPIIP